MIDEITVMGAGILVGYAVSRLFFFRRAKKQKYDDILNDDKYKVKGQWDH
jgi:hypothetical protein